MDISDLSLATDALPEHLGEALPVGAAPVMPDDVLEMHEFLAGIRRQLWPTFGQGASRTDGAERR